MRKDPLPFIFLAAFLLPLLLPAGDSAAETPSLYELRGSVNGGTSLQDLKSESYGAKLLPTVGGSLGVFIKKERALNYGIEFSYDHNFQSDDKNYYYYSAYERLGFTPMVELFFPGRGPRFYVTGGLGANVAFSGYVSKAYLASRVGAGIHFQKSVFHGILLSYSHGFLSDYRAFETFRASVVFRLLERELR